MRAALLALVAPLLLVSTVVAQETTTGSVTGRIVDAQGLGVPGVTVIVRSDQGEKNAVTDDQGRFFVPYLTPGRYTVRAELTGFAPAEQSNIDIRLGQRVEVSLKLQVSGVSEAVQVQAGPPSVDVTNTTVGANLDAETLGRLPVGRSVSDTLYLAPGVSSGGGTGSSNPSVAGASGLENQYVIDGVNITNAGYGALGSYSIVFGSLGTGVNYDFIQEVQVKTAGYEAEYGEATGGVVNVVTKSGSNNLRGALFGYWRPQGVGAKYNQVTTTNATRPEAVNITGTDLSDAGIELGGPVVRDRLFFFGAIDPQRQDTRLIAPIGFPLRDLGDQHQLRNSLAYAAKATFQLTQNHRFESSFFGDPAHGNNGPQRRDALIRTDTSAFSKIAYGGHNQMVRYDGILGAGWLLEASFSRAYNKIEETPSVDQWSVTDTTVTPNVRTGGIGFYEVGNTGSNRQAQAKVTNLLNGWGSHQVRYGVTFEDIPYDNSIQRTGPGFVLPDGTTTATGAEISVLPDPTYGKIYRVTRANLTNVRETTQQYLSFFAQDVWRIGDRLTVRPGVRYEQQKLQGNITSFKWDNNWAPRIGVVYDPSGTGRMKTFANYGRFYAKIPSDLAARAMSADAAVTRADYFDPALTQPVPDGVLAAQQTQHFVTAGLTASTIDPSSKSTYLNEELLGFEWDVWSGLNLGIRYTHRDFGRILEDVGTLPMVEYFLEANPTVNYFLTNPDHTTQVTGTIPASFEDPRHDYDAIEVTGVKRFANRWALQASYRWSRTVGSYEGFFRNDNGQSDPSITSLFDFPTNDPSYVAIGVPQFGFRGDIRYLGTAGEGPLPNDRRHQAKIYGNYTFPINLNVGLGVNFSTGQPLTALAANPVYDSAGEIPETPRGGGFETVDGFRTRTPNQFTVDGHLDYRVPIANRSILLIADGFNIFNHQTVTDYDNFTETSFQVPNPDFGTRIIYTTPRQIRFGVRFEF